MYTMQAAGKKKDRNNGNKPIGAQQVNSMKPFIRWFTPSVKETS